MGEEAISSSRSDMPSVSTTFPTELRASRSNRVQGLDETPGMTDLDTIRARIDEPIPSPEDRAPIWTPTGPAARRQEVLATIPNESALLAVCTRPIAPQDGHRLGNEKKEHELAALFDALSSAEALALHRRLANPRADDNLATAFEQRIAIERRKRLLAYLGSAKRRAALGR